jgi:hypothetical protein
MASSIPDLVEDFFLLFHAPELGQDEADEDSSDD